MARPREFDEKEVKERAMEVFWDRGFEAVSIDDLVEATGLSRSSIYQAFGNKRGLFEAALDFYATERLQMMLGGLEAEGAGRKEILAFFAMFEQVAAAHPDRFALGCLITNTMTELGRGDPTIRNVGTAYVARLGAAFLNATSNTTRSSKKATARAELLATLALGAFVRARGADAATGMPSVHDVVKSTIASWD